MSPVESPAHAQIQRATVSFAVAAALLILILSSLPNLGLEITVLLLVIPLALPVAAFVVWLQKLRQQGDLTAQQQQRYMLHLVAIEMMAIVAGVFFILTPNL